MTAFDVVLDSEHHDQRILKALGRTGAVKIIELLSKGGRRFTQLMIESKLNPGSLDRCLKSLMDAGLVEKSESGMYSLTKKGCRVALILEQLQDVLKLK